MFIKGNLKIHGRSVFSICSLLILLSGLFVFVSYDLYADTDNPDNKTDNKQELLLKEHKEDQILDKILDYIYQEGKLPDFSNNESDGIYQYIGDPSLSSYLPDKFFGTSFVRLLALLRSSVQSRYLITTPYNTVDDSNLSLISQEELLILNATNLYDLYRILLNRAKHEHSSSATIDLLDLKLQEMEVKRYKVFYWCKQHGSFPENFNYGSGSNGPSSKLGLSYSEVLLLFNAFRKIDFRFNDESYTPDTLFKSSCINASIALSYILSHYTNQTTKDYIKYLISSSNKDISKIAITLFDDFLSRKVLPTYPIFDKKHIFPMALTLEILSESSTSLSFLSEDLTVGPHTYKLLDPRYDPIKIPVHGLPHGITLKALGVESFTQTHELLAKYMTEQFSFKPKPNPYSVSSYRFLTELLTDDVSSKDKKMVENWMYMNGKVPFYTDFGVDISDNKVGIGLDFATLLYGAHKHGSLKQNIIAFTLIRWIGLHRRVAEVTDFDKVPFDYSYLPLNLKETLDAFKVDDLKSLYQKLYDNHTWMVSFTMNPLERSSIHRGFDILENFVIQTYINSSCVTTFSKTNTHPHGAYDQKAIQLLKEAGVKHPNLK